MRVLLARRGIGVDQQTSWTSGGADRVSSKQVYRILRASGQSMAACVQAEWSNVHASRGCVRNQCMHVLLNLPVVSLHFLKRVVEPHRQEVAAGRDSWRETLFRMPGQSADPEAPFMD